jgi:uncharacterized protein (DUF58 family)
MKLSSNRTFILPTRYGAIFFLVILVEFIVSISFGHPFAYFMTFMSISIVVVSAFYTNNTLEHIDLNLICDDLVEAQRDNEIGFEISIIKDLGPRVIEACFEGDKTKNQEINKGSKRIYIPYRNDSRGVFKLDRIKLSTTYPFGLFYAWRYLNPETRIFIFPKVLSVDSFLQESTSGLEDIYQSNIISLNRADFLEHRKATNTDSWKDIDWKAFSRGMGLLTKLYSDSSGESMDLRLFDDSDESEIQNVSSFIVESNKRGLVTSLYFNDELISSGHQQDHTRASLKFISSIGGES